ALNAVALLVHRREKDLQVIRIRVHARDDSGEYLRDRRIVNRERMMRARRNRDRQGSGHRRGRNSARSLLSFHLHTLLYPVAGNDTTSIVLTEAEARSVSACSTRKTFGCPGLFEVEQIFLFGPFHAFLMVLLPDLGPRAAIHVRDLVLDD